MHLRSVLCILYSVFCLLLSAQQPIAVGSGSYASYVPLSKSQTSQHSGCQAYQMEHRRLYLPDSLIARLGSPDGSQPGTLALPTNDWWTYALVNPWTGKIWMYPGWVEATDEGVDIGYPTYWEPTGCEMKWDTPLRVTFINTTTGKRAAFKEALVDSWSDFAMSFLMQDGDAWVRVTCMHGSPLVWFEASGISMQVTNPDVAKYAVFTQNNQLSIALLTDGLNAEAFAPYAFRIPRQTRVDYHYDANTSSLSTTFSVSTQNVSNDQLPTTNDPVLLGFLPHHYYNTIFNFQFSIFNYLTPRGQMRLAEGNEFTFTYPVHSFLPYFPAPIEWDEDFSATRMAALNADYAKRGSFGGDTYWGGKGLTQMAHYMTFALQMGDTATFRMAKQRLKDVLIDWYTFTPGEERYYFARYNRWGALIGMDPSYDSETFNDHHFHYGYFVYASAILCLLDDEFRTQYGPMAREVARDYANWQRPLNTQHSTLNTQPWFRTLDPYCGHSFAGGLGNQGNGNGQESSSEAIQGWGGVYMLGAALQDPDMLEAGIFGYTLETRATVEYWFDRNRRNIDFTKYNHPYCCNLTMQGVGWWTWFSGDPVWMHSIQWLPISPILTNFFSEDLAFTRWDYTQMYAAKEVGNYEAAQNGLGDESGLGNVCLSYLSLFDADSAAHVWSRMDQMGKALAKNPDTGGITYWLAHSHKGLGEKRYDIFADHPLACAYTDTVSGRTTYAVYNVAASPLTVHFFGAVDTTVSVPHGLTLVSGNQIRTVTTIRDEEETVTPDSMAWDLPYPNLALHKPVTASSEENAGCLAQNLTDGSTSTRWGSAHRDGEYAIVDLQQVCYIDHLILRWETAYATEYELALSDDQQTWRTVTLSSAGGVETIHLSTLNTQHSTCRARYIRLTGLQRATQYGTSLYELEAYGRPLVSTGELFVIELSATDTVVPQGQTTTLGVRLYDSDGHLLTGSASLSVTSGRATLQGNVLHCPDYGIVTVTATAGNLSSSLDIIVLETEQTDSAVVVPAEVTMPLGDSQRFAICPINQFGMATDTCYETFRATRIGDTTLIFTCFGLEANAIAHVLPYSQVNLALHKPVTASGSENDGTVVANAVDGQLDTRWSSRFQDNEWIAVDLEQCYLLNRVILRWEAAYASSYELQLSQDGENYETVYANPACTGGNDTIDLSTLNPQLSTLSGRYIRLLCLTRNTGYGASLWELEVYGDGRCTPDDTAIQTPTDNPSPRTITKFIRNGQLFILRDGVVYTVGGLIFRPVRN